MGVILEGYWWRWYTKFYLQRNDNGDWSDIEMSSPTTWVLTMKIGYSRRRCDNEWICSEHADDASLVDGELYYTLPLKESLCPECFFNDRCDYYSEDEDEDEDEEWFQKAHQTYGAAYHPSPHTIQRKEESTMYKDGEIIDQNVYVANANGKLIPTTVIVRYVMGGKRVSYIDADGNIIKEVPLSRSKYDKKK